MALFNALETITEDQLVNLNQGVKAGVSIVSDACLAPLRRIVHNAGGSGDVVFNELARLKQVEPLLGYNAAKSSYENLIQAGVIDPVKVTKTALNNAASVASTFLNLDAVIVEEER